jgi:hypothetical protein
VTDDRNETLAEVIDERVQVYGDPTATFPQIAQVWSGYLGVEIKATDVPIMQLLMKTVRLRQAPNYSDNSDDIEGYLDIFRKLVGDDMISARSVDEFIAKRKEREKQEHPLIAVSNIRIHHQFLRRPHFADRWYCSGCDWHVVDDHDPAKIVWEQHHALSPRTEFGEDGLGGR